MMFLYSESNHCMKKVTSNHDGKMASSTNTCWKGMEKQVAGAWWRNPSKKLVSSLDIKANASSLFWGSIIFYLLLEEQMVLVLILPKGYKKRRQIIDAWVIIFWRQNDDACWRQWRANWSRVKLSLLLTCTSDEVGAVSSTEHYRWRITQPFLTSVQS